MKVKPSEEVRMRNLGSLIIIYQGSMIQEQILKYFRNYKHLKK